MTRPKVSKTRQALISKLVASGSTEREITAIVNCSRATIKEVRLIHHDTIEHQRKRLAGRLVTIAGPILDRIERQVRDDSFVTSTKDLAITSGILLDKYERMTGAPTQVIKVEHSDPGREDYARWLNMRQVDTTSIEDESKQSTADKSQVIDTNEVT